MCPVGRWRRTEGTSRREQRRAASGPLKAPSAYPGCEEPTSGRATTSRRAAGLVGQTADKEPRGGSIRAGERTPVMWVVIYRRLVDELGEQERASMGRRPPEHCAGPAEPGAGWRNVGKDLGIVCTAWSVRNARAYKVHIVMTHAWQSRPMPRWVCLPALVALNKVGATLVRECRARRRARGSRETAAVPCMALALFRRMTT